MRDDKTPADLAITPRDRRFGRGSRQDRWWMNGDPVATAFHNALSVTFPRGEAFFIESVKAFRDGVPAKLDREIRAFVQQEVMHSREHVAFNRRVVDAGYDVSHLEQVVVESLELTRNRPQILNLAVTMALEHYTAMMAQMMLKDADYWRGVDRETADMWKWHAIEEIEHKGVAYDTWLHATRDWSRWKRWKVKTIMMLLVSRTFWVKRIEGTLELLAQDGITGARAKWGVFAYLLGRPGVVRRLIPAWLAFFMPGFHPWNHDDRALIAKADSVYPDARAPQPA
ncbi:metal-dependent hydrolase [Sphingomonas changnyeongensis]|uniref:Metal-dependent hydrolase n=1 Tax=Sphingomonas changnyeongensis TaxID=2698679 RepID=A0A7Z2S953_9SPHN|nr:metal-dependent hydrolase [Sphingomonas changnyeongensis]QHL90404.1 metal-dependent hydrolase [Sphingomonas changnyeongensis]